MAKIVCDNGSAHTRATYLIGCMLGISIGIKELVKIATQESRSKASYVLLVGGKHETVFHEMDILKEIRYFQERKLLKPKFPNPLMVVEAREALRWPTPGSPALFGGAGPIKKVDPGKKEETTTLYLLDGITTCF